MTHMSTDTAHMPNTPIEHDTHPVLMSVLATTLKWLIDEKSVSRSVAGHLRQIEAMHALSDRELALLGIRREEITEYVLDRVA